MHVKYVSEIQINIENSKPIEKLGRKAMGLMDEISIL